MSNVVIHKRIRLSLCIGIRTAAVSCMSTDLGTSTLNSLYYVWPPLHDIKQQGSFWLRLHHLHDQVQSSFPFCACLLFEPLSVTFLQGRFFDAVVKVYCIHTEPNYSLPWQRKRQYSSTSSGFMVKNVEGQRCLLTNAHSVEYHTQVCPLLAFISMSLFLHQAVARLICAHVIG